MTTRAGFKVTLPGYDAQTETDPNHCSLFVDQATDYILVKEKASGSVLVPDSTAINIGHGLNYVPFCLVFAEISAGVWRKLFSRDIVGSGIWFEVDGTNLQLNNFSGASHNFAYHIFYDNIT